MPVAAKIVDCTAGFEYFKRLATLRTARLYGIMHPTAITDKFAVAERQRLLTFFTHHTHYVLPALRYSEQKKGPDGPFSLTLILFHVCHQTLTLTLLGWRQQITLAFVRVFTLFELNTNWRSHHIQ